MTLRTVLGAVAVVALVQFGGVPALAQSPARLDACVPAELRRDAITFRTDDHVELPGLVFGSGSRGVLLAHSGVESVCAWLPLARQLTEDGYQVLLYQARTKPVPHGSYGYDLDVVGAARELVRRDVSAVVAAGVGESAAGVVASAERIPGLRGMFVISAEEDPGNARQVAADLDLELKVVQGTDFRTALAEDIALRHAVRSFARETVSSPGLLVLWLTIGVVLLAAVVLLRRRTRPPVGSADS